jgi:hypothetical protein
MLWEQAERQRDEALATMSAAQHRDPDRLRGKVPVIAPPAMRRRHLRTAAMQHRPVTWSTSMPRSASSYAITADLPVHDRVRAAFEELALSL